MTSITEEEVLYGRNSTSPYDIGEVLVAKYDSPRDSIPMKVGDRVRVKRIESDSFLEVEPLTFTEHKVPGLVYMFVWTFFEKYDPLPDLIDLL